jgi:hypothetical protein
MPCMDPRDDWSRDHAFEGARLLCAILTSEDGFIPKEIWSPELAAWWIDHQDMDAYFRRREKERR